MSKSDTPLSVSFEGCTSIWSEGQCRTGEVTVEALHESDGGAVTLTLNAASSGASVVLDEDRAEHIGKALVSKARELREVNNE